MGAGYINKQSTTDVRVCVCVFSCTGQRLTPDLDIVNARNSVWTVMPLLWQSTSNANHQASMDGSPNRCIRQLAETSEIDGWGRTEHGDLVRFHNAVPIYRIRSTIGNSGRR